VSTTEAGGRIAPSPFARDVLMSAATAMMTMASVVLVTGWLAAGLGPLSFAVYALARRVSSAAAAVSPGPLAVGLARALAATPERRVRDAYLWAGTLLAIGPVLAMAVVGAAFPAFWADLLLSDARYVPELLAILGLIVGNAIYSLVFARLRGTSRIRSATLWQLWVLAVGPVIVVGFAAKGSSLTVILLLLAALSFTALVPLVTWLARAGRSGTRPSDLRPPLLALFRYSAPRVPGTAALASLLSLGPLLAPYFGDLRGAGYLVAAQSVFRVAELGTAGFGLVVLPKVSALLAGQRDQFLRERVEDLLGLVLHLGIFAACQLAIWAPEIVSVWLGAAYQEAVPTVRVLLIALMPYLGYTLLRSVIDGMNERPVNTWNVYGALACTAVLSLILGVGGAGALGLAVATAIGFVVLGALTFRYLWESLRLGGAHIHAGAAVALNLAAALAVLLGRSVLLGRLGQPGLLLAGAGLSATCLAVYLFVLRRLEVRWLVEIETRLLRRGARSSGR
jgi:O-antigen/teichoic acid export membrane protein